MGSVNTEIERTLVEAGAALVGFADLISLPADIRQSMPRAVSIAVALEPAVIGQIVNGPTKAYFAEYNMVNNLLSRMARDTVEFLEGKGHNAFATEPTVKLAGLTGLASGLPHKTVATRAGLGWVGKSNLLITESFGSAVRLVMVLTDAPIDTGQPIDKCRCGNCNECVVHCPAGALTGNSWRAGCEREELVDVYVCRETAERHCGDIGLEATVCGVCINVCPFTRKYLSRQAID